MDPLTPLLGGAELARGRMSFYISLQLASVLAPVLVVLTEGTVLVNQLRHEDTLRTLAGATGVLGVMVAICALAGELEINVLAAILAPVLLASANLMVAFGFHWTAVVAGPVGALLFCAVLLDSLLRLRVSEKREAVENLLLDYLARRAAALPPYASAPQAEAAAEAE
ncbi:hypothetical protein ABZU32_25635 [Sphaerisporangium sp. NPDC005288]|uniref:hypothetical protein n=1 Tax=Sphaerisporangium sp. NPDC005288 TaxID=3155114 RepID=UPI0033AD5B3E